MKHKADKDIDDLISDELDDGTILSPVAQPEDNERGYGEILTPSDRPTNFNDFVGQKKIVEELRTFIMAAKERKEPLDHALLLGPPGLGKTTLANIIANELGVQIKVTSGPVLSRAGDVAALLTGLRRGDVLFIDEIHRLNRSVEEVLYPAMEDYHFDVLIGKGPTARSLRMKVQPFTLIGATTREGDISAPMRTRFGVVSRIDYYTVDELTELVEAVSRRLNYPVERAAAREIASCSRGTPRVAIRMFKRMRDVAQVNKQEKVNLNTVEIGLRLLHVDKYGLGYIDRKILEVLLKRFNGGPVSLDTLAVSVGEEADTLYDVYESFLIQIGFLARTGRGRVATKAAWDYMGLKAPDNLQTQVVSVVQPHLNFD